MAAPVADYPFANWTDYFKALSEHFSTEFYGETYPAYERLHDSQGSDADLQIVTGLLDAGASPQEGFDMLLKTCIIHHRYSAEFIDDPDFPSILRAFFDRGARLNLDILTATHIAEEPKHFEDEAYSAEPRGLLIWKLKSFVPDILVQLDVAIHWNHLAPAYWEDIEEDPDTMEELRVAVYRSTKHSYLEAADEEEEADEEESDEEESDEEESDEEEADE